MVKYTLYYFKARARAETIRLVFAAAGVPFEDKRLGEEWPAFKPKTPTGMLPVLEIDGHMITESIAIARYVARETGLAGKNSLDQARVDAVVDTLTELRNATLALYMLKDFGSVPAQSKVAEMESALQEKVTKNLTLVEGQMSLDKGQSYLQGDYVTWADLHFYAVVEVIKYALPDVLRPYPLLQGLEKRVAELPRVAAYLKKRPVSRI